MKKVAVLLAHYHGERHLRAQLESLEAQDWRTWRLIFSDDGAADHQGGRDILRAFSAQYPAREITLRAGPRRGASANFLSMISEVRADEHLAFCDQDDVWKPEKLRRAIEGLSHVTGPALYGARTTLCDENLAPIGSSLRYDGPFDFRNALVQASFAGNSMVISPEGVQLLQSALGAAQQTRLEAHDWWSYQIIAAAGGEVLRDQAEVLFYRQHQDNLQGRNDTARAMLNRITKLGNGRFGAWLAENCEALRPVRETFTPENRDIFDRFDAALSFGGPRAALEFMRIGLRRQGRTGTIALYLAAMSGRLKRR